MRIDNLSSFSALGLASTLVLLSFIELAGIAPSPDSIDLAKRVGVIGIEQKVQSKVFGAKNGT